MERSRKNAGVRLSLVRNELETAQTTIQKLGKAVAASVIESLDKSAPLALSNASGKFIYASPAYLKLSGFEFSELEGQPHKIMNSGYHSTLFWKQMWESLSSGESWRGEVCNRKKSGEFYWTDTSITVIHPEGMSEPIFFEIRQDITDKKQREMVQVVLVNLGQIFATTHSKRKMLHKLLAEVLELTESEWVVGVEVRSDSGQIYDLATLQVQSVQGFKEWTLKEEQYSEFLKLFDTTIESRRPTYYRQGQTNRRRSVNFDPLIHKFNSFLAIPIQTGSKILGVIGLANRRGGYRESNQQKWQPIYDFLAQSFENSDSYARRRKLESDLRNHLILLEQSQEVAGIGGWTFDLESQEMFWTRQLYILFGCDPTVFKPSLASFSAFVEASAVGKLTNKVHGLIQSLQEFDFEIPVSHRFGEGRWVRIIGRPQYENGQVHRVIGAVQEVTQLKLKEQQVEYQKDKAMANSRATALGQMAGGIAHEINNPLTIVLGTAKHLKTSSERNELVDAYVQVGTEKIIQATNRIAKVIKGLKAFAREGSKDPIVDCSVKMILDDTFTFCEARVRNHGIVMEIPQLEHDLRLRCRPVEIAQALLNLVMNSDSAVRGTLSPWIKVTFEQDKHWSVFRITDSGKGIPRAVADRMMEPFYSTKAPGMGMGLGLSVVFSIVMTHSGQFFLDSDCPNTSFVIKIPRHI
jgi:PAS domain S-box-containing protein